MEERRDLAFLQPLDDQFDGIGPGRRADRITPLGLIAVGGGQADIDMLAGHETPPMRGPEEEALDLRRLDKNRDDRRLLPFQALRGNAGLAHGSPVKRCSFQGSP